MLNNYRRRQDEAAGRPIRPPLPVRQVATQAQCELLIFPNSCLKENKLSYYLVTINLNFYNEQRERATDRLNQIRANQQGGKCLGCFWQRSTFLVTVVYSPTELPILDINELEHILLEVPPYQPAVEEGMFLYISFNIF